MGNHSLEVRGKKENKPSLNNKKKLKSERSAMSTKKAGAALKEAEGTAR